MTISEKKEKIRLEMRSLRANLSQSVKKKYDDWVCNALWETIKENNFKTVHCYLPMGTEIDILPLIEDLLGEKIIVITPKVLSNRKLQNLVLSSLEKLEKGVFGTRHPANANEFEGQIDLIIVPGLSFDNLNYRLGYGGGYYDNFMHHHSDAWKVGVFYPFQKMTKVPLEAHDVQLNEILVDMNYSME